MPQAHLNRARRRELLREQSLNAVWKTWTVPMKDLFEKLASLPSRTDDAFDRYGFVFAIDGLRYDAPAVKALLQVADEMEIRPTYHETFDLIERLFAFKVEVGTFLSQTQRRTKGKVGFVRGKGAAKVSPLPSSKTGRRYGRSG